MRTCQAFNFFRNGDLSSQLFFEKHATGRQVAGCAPGCALLESIQNWKTVRPNFSPSTCTALTTLRILCRTRLGLFPARSFAGSSVKR
jgi:hypothetical protein